MAIDPLGKGNPLQQFGGRRRIVQGGALQIQELINGWARNNSSGVPVQGGKGQYTLSRNVNMNRLNFLGHLSAGEVFTALFDPGPLLNGCPLNADIMQSNAGDTTYFGHPYFAILSTGRMVMFDMQPNASPSETLNKWDVDLTAGGGGHAAHTGPTDTPNNDMLVVQYDDPSVGPTAVILSSWEDNTDADIQIMGGSYQAGSPLYATPTPDFFSHTLSGGSVLRKGVSHKMKIHPNGTINILNGEYVANIVQTTLNTALSAWTANAQALHLGPGWVATSLFQYQNFMAIVAYQNTAPAGDRQRCRMFLWDGSNADPNYFYDIPDFYVASVFNFEGTIIAFTQGSNGSTRFFAFTGTRWKMIYEFGPSYTGSGGDPSHVVAGGIPPMHGGMDTYFGYLHFLFGGVLPGASYSGSPAPPQIFQTDGRVIHQVMLPSDGSFNSGRPGFLKNLDQSGLYMGMSDTSNPWSSANHKIFYIDPLSYATGSFLKTCLYALPYKATVSGVKIFFSQWGTGAGIKIKMFRGFDTSSDLLSLNLSYNGSVLGSKNVGTTLPYYSQPLEIPNLDSVWFEIDWTHTDIHALAAVIRAIEVEYSFTGQPI